MDPRFNTLCNMKNLFIGQMILTKLEILKDNCYKIALVSRDLETISDEDKLFLNRNFNSELSVAMKSGELKEDDIPDKPKPLNQPVSESKSYQVRNKWLFKLYKDLQSEGKITDMSFDDYYNYYYENRIIPMIQTDIDTLNKHYE